MTNRTIKLDQNLGRFFAEQKMRRKVVGLALTGELVLDGVDVNTLKRIVQELRRGDTDESRRQ
ncbi:hypothetical protein BK670_20000 [Pseudomonas fluorescens]|uniref:Uncharacterized protein n=1 Tax=Pseudomonas fluorescens TaxID=294 RepID=A0A423MAF8_PSEFL|nr:hypothetical protein BK670_20000 [Pseudomonas fluorescens]